MSSRKSPDVERGGAGGGEKRYVRTDSARSMGSRTASTRSMGSAKNSSSSLVGSPEGSPKAKWNLPDKSLKKIARSGVYTEWCCDREDLWRQCLGISNLKEDIDAVRPQHLSRGFRLCLRFALYPPSLSPHVSIFRFFAVVIVFLGSGPTVF